MMPILKVRDFSIKPGVRYRYEGPYSGEEYREDILDPLFKSSLTTGEKITIVLDGVYGYATSFLEEVFGGLVRQYGYSKVRDLLVIISNQRPYYESDIYQYMDDAK